MNNEDNPFMFNRECIFSLIPAYFSGGFPHCSAAKNPPANVGDTGYMALVPRLGGPLERKWQPSPLILPGEIPWTEEPGRLQSMGLHRVGHALVTKPTTTF